MKHVSELEKSMTFEQKALAKVMYDKFYGIPFGHLEPVYCGPEARAREEGSEALETYYKEGMDCFSDTCDELDCTDRA